MVTRGLWYSDHPLNIQLVYVSMIHCKDPVLDPLHVQVQPTAYKPMYHCYDLYKSFDLLTSRSVGGARHSQIRRSHTHDNYSGTPHYLISTDIDGRASLCVRWTRQRLCWRSSRSLHLSNLYKSSPRTSPRRVLRSALL